MPANIDISTHHLSGQPASKILEFTKAHNTDLIIMGCRKLNLFSSILNGSTSRQILEKSTCPVIIVKLSLEGFLMTDIKRILVPVDGSETSDRAIEEAIKIAEVYNSDIHILYVANINQLAINACLSDAILEAVTKAGNEILEKAANKVPEKINVITTSDTGSPSVTITDFADEIKADLVVIGSRGLGLVKGVLLGSVSQYVVEHAPCPALVVK